MKTKLNLVLFLALVSQLPAQIEVISGGNVGIGTSSPGAKFHMVDDSANTVRNVIYDQTSNDSGGFQVNIRKVRGISGALQSGDSICNLTLGGFDGSTYATGANIRAITAGNWTGSSHPTYLRFDTTNVNETAVSMRMVISEAGNVGIGTTSPQEKLQVAGNIFLSPADKYLKIYANTEGTDSIVFARSDDTNQASIATTAFGKSILFKVQGAEIVRFRNDGNVGIGTASPGYKLEVAGTVRATSFISDSATYADFVFKPGYKLASLAEVEASIQEHGHLPGIPSEAEAREHGIDLSAMQVKLLQKVEELTLHVITLEKRTRSLEEENARLKNQP